MTTLTPQQIEQFHADAIIVVRQVFSAGEQAEILAALNRIRERATRELPSQVRKLKDGSTWGLSHTFRPGYFEPAMAGVLEHPVIQHVLTTLLNSTELRMWGDHALWSSDTCDYNLRWHRDKTWGDQPFPTYDRHHPHHIQFNAAFGPDHSFLAVPGSHLREATPFEQEVLERGGTDPLPGEVGVLLEPGDVLFMNAWAIHRGQTAAGSGRRTVHFSVQPAHLEPMPGQCRDAREGIFHPELASRLGPCARRMYDNFVRFQETLPEAASEQDAMAAMR